MKRQDSTAPFRQLARFLALLGIVLLTVMGSPVTFPALAAATPHGSPHIIAATVTSNMANGSYSLTPASRAATSVVRKLCSNAYLYSSPEGPGRRYLRTVHEGRGFRVYYYGQDSQGRWWAYGHSAEAPNTNGWILAKHLC